MTLKMTLEPQEWLMVGKSRVVNIWHETAKFKIDGAGPILRQAHTLSEQDINTAAKRVYLSLQRLYLGLTTNTDSYILAVEGLLAEHPSLANEIRQANELIASGSFYGALRMFRKLANL